MPVPAAVAIELSADERALLESWVRRRTSAQALALRSRIVLAAADSLTNPRRAYQSTAHVASSTRRTATTSSFTRGTLTRREPTFRTCHTDVPALTSSTRPAWPTPAAAPAPTSRCRRGLREN